MIKWTFRKRPPSTLNEITIIRYLCKKIGIMKAIELNAKTDKHGHLKINYTVNQRESNVRVIILVDEKNDDIDEEGLWIKTISSNPSFDFLQDSDENIYSLADGEPLFENE
jgi:hypothetical protein